MSGSILVVDDEPTQRRLLSGLIERDGYWVEAAADGAQALARIEDADAPAIDCVILDLIMPELSGLEVLQRLRPGHPELPVIVLTAQSSVNRVVEVMRAGANDFIVKPASAERLRTAIASALDKVEMTGELAPIRAQMREHPGFNDLIGASDAMAETVRLAKRAAATSIPVLIEGESGVGKEMFAHAIHEASDRADGPFIAVNCGAIPENLVESLLFGHEKGSFTGAADRHIGKFQEASGGTLFLDEVGELPLDIQVKLLRVLQEGEVDPVGARRPVSVDIRLISATNRNMAARVAEGGVREDLFYRLNVFPLYVPPLRDRREDIAVLARHFIASIVRSEDLKPKTLSDQALDLLTRYHWPGNIRQLQNAIFRAVVMSDAFELAPQDFPQIGDRPRSDSPDAVSGINGAHQAETAGQAEDHRVSLLDRQGEVRTLSDIESETIRKAIRRYNGRMSEVARRLGIGRSTLYRKIAELGLEEDKQEART